MKNIILAIIGILGTSIISYAQQPRENRNTSKVDFYVALNHEFVNTQDDKIQDHHSAGLEFGLQVKENYNIGIFHLFSYSPDDLWVSKPENSDDLKVLQYGLNLSYREKLNRTFYWQGGTRIALGDVRQMYKDDKDCDCPDRLKTSDSFTTTLISPHLKLGLHIVPWLSVEAGLTYRMAVGNKNKWGIHADDLEGLGTIFSLKGSF